MSRYQLATLLPYKDLHVKYVQEMNRRKALGLPLMDMVEWCESKDRIAEAVQRKRQEDHERQYAGNQNAKTTT
jgi:hypothetical protein